MKRKFDLDKEIHSDKLGEVLLLLTQKVCNADEGQDLPFPYTKDFLTLCKEENPFRQEYYWIEAGENYAFFIVYYDRLNIFTLGKSKLLLNVKTIGFPCSLSDCGYITNNLAFMLDYIKTMKGGKLILNVKNPVPMKNAVLGETLPTCMFAMQSSSMEEYMKALRSPYRRRIRIAQKKCANITVRQTNDENAQIYNLYLNTYEKSEFKLERLEKGFFERVDATRLVFYKQEKPIGFVLLKKVRKQLIFMLCGMDYNYPTADLYYFMLYHIIEYAMQNGCEQIDFGQTSEQTKMKFGAVLEKRYFYAIHSNVFMRAFAKLVKPLLEYRYHFPEYRVMKDEKK